MSSVAALRSNVLSSPRPEAWRLQALYLPHCVSESARRRTSGGWSTAQHPSDGHSGGHAQSPVLCRHCAWPRKLGTKRGTFDLWNGALKDEFEAIDLVDLRTDFNETKSFGQLERRHIGGDMDARNPRTPGWPPAHLAMPIAASVANPWRRYFSHTVYPISTNPSASGMP